MNKGIIALIVVLALLVLISPGIVGMLAERSVDEQIERADRENQDLVITAERFDRGWFSSQGRHRIELRESGNAGGIKMMLVPFFGHTMPALIVDTTLTHWPIAMPAGENRSLSPGLGRAVSTLSFESADGQLFALPGTVYSTIGLTGDFTSNYAVAAGSGEIGAWGDVDITFAAASNGAYAYDGSVASMQIADGGPELSNLEVSGDLAISAFGYAVGDMSLKLDYLLFDDGARPPFSIGPVIFETSSAINAGKLGSSSRLNMIVGDVPGLGHVGLDTQFSLDNVDGAALQRLLRSVQRAQAGNSPDDIVSAVEAEVLDLFAAGADLRIERLDIALPQGTINSVLNLTFLENDSANPSWSSQLLALEADAKVEVPEVIANMAMLMSPQAGMIESFLIKNGDVYELEAAYKKGLLTINGVPFALPIQ